MHKPNDDPRPRARAPGAIGRRTALEWLGSSAALALGADLVAACARLGDGVEDATLPPPADGPDAPPPPCDAAAEFPFQPGARTGPPFDGWSVRTVDSQDLVELLARWTLRVDGLVARPATYGFADLACLPRQDQVTDFHCVEGWSVLDVPWTGVHLSHLLGPAGPSRRATHVTFHTWGGDYDESLPLDVALEPRTLLAYGAAGRTLPLAHGFPLRIVIPRLLGYKSAKFVHRVELTDRPISGYWVARGYPYDGLVPEDRLRPGKY